MSIANVPFFLCVGGVLDKILYFKIHSSLLQKIALLIICCSSPVYQKICVIWISCLQTHNNHLIAAKHVFFFQTFFTKANWIFLYSNGLSLPIPEIALCTVHNDFPMPAEACTSTFALLPLLRYNALHNVWEEYPSFICLPLYTTI